MLEISHKAVLVRLIQMAILDEQGEITHKDALEQAAIACALILQDALCQVAQTRQRVRRGAYGIAQEAVLPRDTVQFIAHAYKRALVIGEHPVGDLIAVLSIHAVIDRTGTRGIEVVALPVVDALCQIQVSSLLTDAIHTGSDDAGRSVATGVLAPWLTLTPGHAAMTILGVPGILDVIPEQLGGIQVFLVLGTVIEP